jgi:hypothetical protein
MRDKFKNDQKNKIKAKKSLAQSPNVFTIEKYLNLKIP